MIHAFNRYIHGFWHLERSFSDEFAVFLLKSAPEKCVFIKYVPQLRLKVN